MKKRNNVNRRVQLKTPGGVHAWDSSRMINHRVHTVGRYRCENIIQPVGILLNPTKLWSSGLIRYSNVRGRRAPLRSFRLRVTCKSFRRYVAHEHRCYKKAVERERERERRKASFGTNIYEIWIFSSDGYVRFRVRQIGFYITRGSTRFCF